MVKELSGMTGNGSLKRIPNWALALGGCQLGTIHGTCVLSPGSSGIYTSQLRRQGGTEERKKGP